MFRALCAHHQEVKIVLYSIWYHHTYRWPSVAQVGRGPVHRTATYRCDVEVLQTVHLSMILVINQLNAQNLVLQ